MSRRWMWFALVGLVGCFGGAPEPEAAKPDVEVPKKKRAPKPKSVKATGPNVVVLIWDTVRADHLTPYGYSLDTTPELAKLAAQSVVFERAISPGEWTVPSHASLFTGLPVRSHGARSSHKRLAGKFTTMAEWFSEQGYGTYLFSANPFVGSNTSMDQGFDLYEAPWSDRWKAKAEAVTRAKLLPQDASNELGPVFERGKMPTGRPADKGKDAGPVTAEALFTWLDERDDKGEPFLAVLNYMEAHVPRVPSLAARQALFGEDDIARQLSTDQSLGELLAYTVGKVEFDAQRLATIAQTYDASLRDLDAVSALVWRGLSTRGLLEDTIVVITSDHGEHLGEHHKIGHKFSVYNPLVRVPLLIHYPKGLPPGRVSQPVSTAGLYATLVELTGVAVPPELATGSLLHPEALPELVLSELVEATPQALERVGKFYGEIDWTPFLHPLLAGESGEHKCIVRDDGQRELYRVTTDPLETSNLIGGEAATLCEQVSKWGAETPTFVPRKGRGKEQEVDEATREQLEGLGYLDAVE
jgi:arylsulfatase A-like enzyme